MRVLIVNTSEREGGAAIAASRLNDALNNNGVKARMLVRDKQSDTLTVIPTGHRWLMRWRFLWERWCIFCRLMFQRANLFAIDTAQCGMDITSQPEFREADIIHLHWVNQGMLSLGDIRRILKSGKPVVWTMHDYWPATAICHLPLSCASFKTGCHHCRYLPGGGSSHDLSTRIWRRKHDLLSKYHITFVACSEWLASEARKSALLREQKVVSIPNPIDTRVFHRTDSGEARRRLGLPTDKRLLLFAAQRVDNANKGISYLMKACDKLVADHPETKDEVHLLLLGAKAEVPADAFGGLTVHGLGYVDDAAMLVDIYNAADAFVLPSLSENLPNTIMEAMACGTPCIGFHVGGIPELIDHRQNGYVATYRDVADLAAGIRWTLYDAPAADLADHAVGKVARNYSQTAVAAQYCDIYHEILTMKHLGL